MLTIDGVHCSYGSGRVLQGIDMTLEQGEVVGILGRNGMGKTSLIRCLFNFAAPTVTAGSIRYAGRDLTRLPPHAIARLGVGLVPQGRMVFPSLTVEENLRSTARSEPGDRWSLDSVYDFFPRLRERAQNLGGELSGGEQQMLAIGRALMTNPRLLVMDEASEGLAPAVLVDIRDRLRSLKDTGLSVLFAEQNVGLACSLADRLYIIGEGGTVVWQGPAADFDPLSEEAHRYLGV